jgi:hypothetical protein
VADPTAVKSWQRGQLLWPRYWPRIVGKDTHIPSRFFSATLFVNLLVVYPASFVYFDDFKF